MNKTLNNINVSVDEGSHPAWIRINSKGPEMTLTPDEARDLYYLLGRAIEEAAHEEAKFAFHESQLKRAKK